MNKQPKNQVFRDISNNITSWHPVLHLKLQVSARNCQGLHAELHLPLSEPHVLHFKGMGSRQASWAVSPTPFLGSSLSRDDPIMLFK